MTHAETYPWYNICSEVTVMVKHIILWKFKEELTAEQKQQCAAEIKAGLEGLAGKIEGLTDIHVYTEGLPTSNFDIMLDSTVTDTEALAYYAGHPAHVKVKDELIVPVTAVRACFDFEV